MDMERVIADSSATVAFIAITQRDQGDWSVTSHRHDGQIVTLHGIYTAFDAACQAACKAQIACLAGATAAA